MHRVAEAKPKQLWCAATEYYRVYPLPFCVYVLVSQRDGDLYIGLTIDLDRRLKEHRNGNSFATSYRLPFELIFCEFYRSKIDALRRERYLKSTKGNRIVRLMLRGGLAAIERGRIASGDS